MSKRRREQEDLTGLHSLAFAARKRTMFDERFERIERELEKQTIEARKEKKRRERLEHEVKEMREKLQKQTVEAEKKDRERLESEKLEKQKREAEEKKRTARQKLSESERARLDKAVRLSLRTRSIRISPFLLHTNAVTRNARTRSKLIFFKFDELSSRHRS